MASPSNDLLGWLEQQLARSSGNTRAPLSRLLLMHMDPSKRGSNVESVVVPAKVEAGWAQQTATWLFEAATSDARAQPGPVESYAVLAYFGEADKPLCRHSMRVRGGDAAEEEDDSDPSSSEPANSTGALAQMMRHNEALMKMATTGSQRTIESLTRQLAVMSGNVERALAKQMEAAEAVEKAASRKHERELETAIVAAREKRLDELTGMAMPLVPMIANKLAGVKMLPGGIKQGDGVRSLVASITEDQVGQLMQVFHPTQQMMLASIIEEMKAEAEAEEKRKAEEAKAREAAH